MNLLASDPPSRVRIRTHPPLRPFQAWVPFNPNQLISSLKSTILSLLGDTQSIPLTAQDILLELDAFAFLDQSLCSLIDPTHDLIDVKTVSPIPSTSQMETSKKRRRSQSKTQLPPNTPSERLPPQRCKSQPAERAIKPLNQSKLTHQPKAANPSKIQTSSTSPSDQKTNAKSDNLPTDRPVPPGQGKPSTKARNQRKKIRRMRERERKLSAIGSLAQGQCDQTSKPQSQPLQLIKGGRNNEGAKTNNSSVRKDGSSQGSTSQTSSQLDESSSDSSPESSSDSSTESSSDSSTSSSESDSEPGTSVPKSTLSEASSHPSELPSKRSCIQTVTAASTQTAAPVTQTSRLITQKTVPIISNPQLTMLSLSNKNKRKNLKRKSCPEQLAQPSKIVFESNVSGNHLRSPVKNPVKNPVKSPCFTPPSPNYGTASASPSLVKASLPQREDVSHDYLAFDEDEEQEFVDYSITHATRSHGPPPSARHADLIPSNILITSINLLDPYWTPGQIGNTYSYFDSTLPQTTSKKTRKNRKKSLKRRRRLAAKTRLLQQGQHEGRVEEEEDEDEGSDGSEFDQEIQRDIENAYAEFIGSGGHSSRLNESDQQGGTFLTTLNQKWDQLEKVDRKTAVLGSQIAIRTIEISVESFTPEPMTYYGTLIGTNEAHLALKLDPGCIPAAQATLETSEYDLDGSAFDDQGWEPGEEEGHEERMVDVKEALRAHQRNALALDVWGGSRDVRDWEWNTIIDARKL
ncbi:hypothetical protein PtA15_15A476 [Puccinia triticina]|uniref:ASX DEUBAD domain-containing protein n=1 Tax=Puccinia triticina TaxID=208348 RepID=A0ABY7D4B3_9BASI|nr:uncharacterized protein PtA15_15A476 [Puccinia triticina]WAQ92080.1 hypothetical protein PtA15_15A476 [Puccinia triticina]